MVLTTNKHQIALYNNASLQVKQIKNIVPALVFQTSYNPNGAVLRTTRSKIRAIAALLRNSTALQATILVDIAGTDKLEQQGRFSIKYSFLSVTYNKRFTVEVFCEETLSIPSLAAPFLNNQKVFAAAG